MPGICAHVDVVSTLSTQGERKERDAPRAGGPRSGPPRRSCRRGRRVSLSSSIFQRAGERDAPVLLLGVDGGEASEGSAPRARADDTDLLRLAVAGELVVLGKERREGRRRAAARDRGLERALAREALGDRLGRAALALRVLVGGVLVALGLVLLLLLLAHAEVGHGTEQGRGRARRARGRVAVGRRRTRARKRGDLETEGRARAALARGRDGARRRVVERLGRTGRDGFGADGHDGRGRWKRAAGGGRGAGGRARRLAGCELVRRVRRSLECELGGGRSWLERERRRASAQFEGRARRSARLGASLGPDGFFSSVRFPRRLWLFRW